MGVEIERKFTVKVLPELDKYPCRLIEQGYLNVSPAIRVRCEGEHYYMTYKGEVASDEKAAEPETAKPRTASADEISKQAEETSRKTAHAPIGKIEYNMPLDKASYEHLIAKSDGNIIRKKRYIIPVNDDAFSEEYLSENDLIRHAMDSGDIRIELDVFEGIFAGRVLAEVEFPDEDSAAAYHMADWFEADVTGNPEYSNAHMSAEKIPD